MRIKRTALLCLTAALALASAAIPAAAYTPAGNAGTTTVNHTLTLTGNSHVLSYPVQYGFSIYGVPTAENVIDMDSAVSGTPVVSPANITIPSGDYSGSGTVAGTTTGYDAGVFTTPLQVDWSGVSFSEPGTYKWQMTKTNNDNNLPETLTNVHDASWIFASVVNDPEHEGELKIASVGITSDADLTEKIGSFDDTYSTGSYDLEISKTVTGNQGSREQYFRFDIEFTTPAASGAVPAAKGDYHMSGNYTPTTIPATAYNNSQDNPFENATTGNVAGGAKKLVTVWLKHGQNFKLEGLPAGTTYKIVERENDGYTVTGEVTEAASLDADANVSIVNNREGVIPTGIILETGAPLAGLALAGALFAILIAGKRRKNRREA